MSLADEKLSFYNILMKGREGGRQIYCGETDSAQVVGMRVCMCTVSV